MGRIRTIKPEFWTDEKVGELKRDERLLFLGLLNLADDEGILKATPAFIKGQIFAYDEDLSIADVRAWLDALVSCKMLVPFEHNSEKFFLIRTFKSHQKINRPTPSKIPKNVIENIFRACSMNTHGILSEDSLPEGKGKEGEREIEQGREEEGNSSPPHEIIPLGSSSVYRSMNDVEFICLNQSSTWLEHMTRKLELKDLENAKNWIIEFFETMRAAGQDKRELNDARQHCFNWIKIQISKEKIPGKKDKGKAEAVLEVYDASTQYWEKMKEDHLNNLNQKP
jgi:hypothetical protein